MAYTYGPYRERYIDTGAPYFYKSRPARSPFLLRNVVIGKALALDVMYPYKFALRVGGPINNKKAKLNLLKRQGGAVVTDETPKLFKRSPFTNINMVRPPSITNLQKEIAIYLWDDYKTQANNGAPYILLDFPPTELDFDVSAQLKPIGIVGLNYPHYHYTGSHETLTMSIQWFDSLKDSDRVVTKCRKMEALSKADGYQGGPEKIYIDWGHIDGEDWAGIGGVLDGHVYSVQSANYKLNTFLARRGTGGPSGPNGFMPLHATQELVLVREAGQLTSKQIIDGII